jgi:hypothetical protein
MASPTAVDPRDAEGELTDTERAILGDVSVAEA